MSKRYYENIKNDILLNKGNYVDSRYYKSHWAHKWVTYCDLIGFANMCLTSNDTTVNSIIRFHRAVAKSQEGLSNCKIYQFTDAAFCVADNPFDAIQFALNVANYSLAHNALTIESKAHTLFHHLIVPRITVASGEVLMLEDISNPELLSGLNKDSFLAGSAIVNAYKIESSTFAGALAINGNDFASLLSSITVRGEADVVKNAMNRWLDKLKEQGTDNIPPIVEIPWTFLTSSNTNGELWTETKASFLSKINTLIDISDKMTGDFVTLNSSIYLGKHQVGLQRHIFDLLCKINRQKKFNLQKFRNPREFINDI